MVLLQKAYKELTLIRVKYLASVWYTASTQHVLAKMTRSDDSSEAAIRQTH